jgi:hypothetical protein
MNRFIGKIKGNGMLKNLTLVLTLFFFQSSFSQMIIKNSTGMVMKVNTNGTVGFRTSNTKGLVSIDSLADSYVFKNMHGEDINGRSCLFVETLDNIDYSSTVKNMGIHAFTYADADPATLTEAKQNIAISAHLLSPDRSKTIGVANLAENWSLGPGEAGKRDVTIVKGSLQNADEMLGSGHDIRTIAAVVGQVKGSYNTKNPEVVFAGYFTGAKSHFGAQVGIGTESPGNDMLDVRGRAYASDGWQTTNGDYAEWFEKEGSSVPGDLIGINLNTGRARKYQPGDRFLGVHSDKPAVVGNRIKENDREMRYTHVLVGLLGQLEVHSDQINISGNLAYTRDGQYVGIKLSNGKVFVGR